MDKESPQLSARYQITILGHFEKDFWTDYYNDLSISQLGKHTVISSAIIDQSALHGIIARIRDLNIFLISVKLIDYNEERNL